MNPNPNHGADPSGPTARAELFLYPGDGHLFADNSSPSYDAEAAALLMTRAIDFLCDVG